MKFYSNTTMLKHYIRELLSDGQEHSIPEIAQYIFDQTEQIGVNGKPFAPNIINNALHSMVYADGEVQNVRRGVYKRGHQIVDNSRLSADQILNNGIRVLDQAVERLDRCFMINLHDSEISYDEILRLGQYGRQIRDVLQQTKETIVTDLINHPFGLKSETGSDEQDVDDKPNEQQHGGMTMKL